jgi:transposase
VHKDTIAVALAEAGARGDVREYGKIANTAAAVKALAAKLSRVGSEFRFCYEAGSCGDRLQQQLTLAGHFLKFERSDKASTICRRPMQRCHK